MMAKPEKLVGALLQKNFSCPMTGCHFNYDEICSSLVFLRSRRDIVDIKIAAVILEGQREKQGSKIECGSG